MYNFLLLNSIIYSNITSGAVKMLWLLTLKPVPGRKFYLVVTIVESKVKSSG